MPNVEISITQQSFEFFVFSSLRGSQKEKSSILILLSAVTLTHMHTYSAAFPVNTKECNATVSRELYLISMDYGVYFYGSSCKRIIAFF